MPELPEVETVARQLAPLIEGRTVRASRLFDPLLGHPPLRRMTGRTVERVRRLGKQVVLELGPDLCLAVHLRMTGRLVWYPAGQAVERRHLRASFALTGGRLAFHDPRRFGTLRLVQTLQALAPPGVEPLCAGFNAQLLGQLLRGSRQAIKVWLLRQDRITGLGNIYASEILHAAAIHPERPASSLTPAEVARLVLATRQVLRRAIECCGTTFSDFQDAHGLTGSYQRYLSVYGREGAACPRCGAAVQRTVQQQRSTFHCAACQR